MGHDFIYDESGVPEWKFEASGGVGKQRERGIRFLLLRIQASLGFDIGPFTFAEAFQMWTENERSKWDHTTAICQYIVKVNSKKGRAPDAKNINPWLSGGGSSQASFNVTNDREPLKALARG